MCSRFINATPLFLVLLKLCVEISETATVEDLSLICSLTDGKTIVKEIPAQCTTLAENTIELSELHSAYILKGSLPFMLILEHADYTRKENIKTTVADLGVNHKFDFIALNMNKILHNNPIEIPPDGTQYVIDYMKEIKSDRGEAVFGFLIRHDTQLLKDHNIDFSRINSISEFYLVDTKCIISCPPPPEPKNGAPPHDTPNLKRDVTPFILALSDMGLALSQLIFNIDLKQESFVLPYPEVAPEYMCGNLNKAYFVNLHCDEPLQCLFDHAKICFDRKLMGVFVQGIEYDDVSGLCGCKTSEDADPKFRCLKIIQAASQKPGPLIHCSKRP